MRYRWQQLCVGMLYIWRKSKCIVGCQRYPINKVDPGLQGSEREGQGFCFYKGLFAVTATKNQSRETEREHREKQFLRSRSVSRAVFRIEVS